MVKKNQLVEGKPVGYFTNRSLIDHQACSFVEIRWEKKLDVNQ